jgi:hypothetical protein
MFRLRGICLITWVLGAGAIFIPAVARAQIYVTSPGSAMSGTGTISEYSTSGMPIHAPVVSGLDDPLGIALSGSDLFVALHFDGKVAEYNATSGATVNPSVVSGLGGDTNDVAVSGSDLFVAHGNTIGEYTTSGSPVSPSFITGLSTPDGIAFSGGDIFVSNYGNNTIGEYTTSGTALDPALISGLHGPENIDVSGSDLFVANYQSGTIGEYTTSGTTVNPALFSTGPDNPYGLALSGSDLYVTNIFNNDVGEYTTSGGTVDPSLLSGIITPFGIAAVQVPEPTSLALIGVSLVSLLRRPPRRGGCSDSGTSSG